MSNAASVRAGKAFVEITANDTDFQRKMKKVQHSVVRLGMMMRQLGSGLAIAGTAMGVPMVLAARQVQAFDDALLELKSAVSDISPSQMARVREESLRLSRAMGVAPGQVAQSFALLIKAGMEFEKAMDGGARAAVEFAAVSGVEAKAAAEFMKISMNVFGLSASEAANTLSAAADSSETDIAGMIEAFGQVASVAKGTGQTLFGVSQALAVLAANGMDVAEAGTGLKTVLLKMLAPTKEAKDALAVMGLSIDQLVDKTGKLLPVSQLAGIFARKIGDMDDEARSLMQSNEALLKVFDVYGIRAMQAFAQAGEDGFARVAKEMESSRSVAEKFEIMMSGVSGSFKKLYSAVERLSIAFMQGAGPALAAFTAAAVPAVNMLAWMLEKMPFLSGAAATLAAVLFGLGTTTYAVGGALSFASFGLKIFINWGTTLTRVARIAGVMIGGIATALEAVNLQLFLMRIRMFAIPGWGWALAGLAAIGGAISWAYSGAGKKSGAKGSGIKRDQPRAPLAEGADAAAMAAAGPKARGEALGTFSASIAAQLGIGPALTAQEQTADNTGRMADGVDALVRQGEARVPGAAALQAGMAPPGVRGGVAARSDRDLVSMSERAAIAAEESRGYLRQLVEKAKNGGLAFA